MMSAHRRLLASVLIVVVAVLAVVAPAGARSAAPDLSPTPPMGFNDWNAYGCNVDASLIESAARYIHDSGMQRDGYRYVNIDDCWLAPTRSASGQLQANPAKFPQGIAPVARYIHRLGLKFGIYEDAGTETCAGYPGSFGHYAQDARTLASWGVDYLKFDQCNIPFGDFPGLTHAQVDARLYTEMSRALKATGRRIVFSACTGVDDTSDPWLWAPKIANLWRTTTDIRDNFASTIVNFEGNVGLWRYAHAGAFNDPDALEIGNGGQTTTEYRAQFSLWAEMAAPLIAGTNLTKLPGVDLGIYENRGVIAVDQDPLARQGRPIADHDGLWVLSKPLADGDDAVVQFNSTDTPQTLSTTAHAIGLRRAPAYGLTNLWTGQVSDTGGGIGGFVPADGVVMYRVARLTSARAATARPATVLSIDATPATLAPSATVTVRLALRDEARVALRGSTVVVNAPGGWSPQRRVVRFGRGRSFTRTLSFTALASPPTPLTMRALQASARITARGLPVAHVVATTPTTIVAPLVAPLTAVNTTTESVLSGQLGGAFSIIAAGTGISPQVTNSHGTRPASDSYAAIDDPGAAAPDSVAQVTVDTQTGSTLAPYGTAGLIERDDLAGGSTPEGVVLQLSTSGTVTLEWAAQGGPAVDSSVTAPGTAGTEVTLRLTRTGSTYVGAYSIDGGVTWTTVGTATVAAAASSGDQDVGIFHSSGTAGSFTQASFSGLQVTP